jgi:hypothetical protein
MKKILISLLLALSLTACTAFGEEKVVLKTKIVPLSPPAFTTVCPDHPPAPTGNYTQRDVAKFIIGLDNAHAQCKASSEELKRWINEAEAIVTQDNEE